MSITAAIFVPLVLAYQIWSYYVFRSRINPKNANIEE
jgi:cytochrome d ubiquinol oxidase subunit II